MSLSLLLLLGGLLSSPAPLSDTSIYQIESSWTNQDGTRLKLAALRGKPVVLAMVFTHCQHSCPRIIADLKRVEAKLTPAQRTQMRFLLVSMDPERDTPAVLAAFAKETRLDLGWWSLLNGSAEDVRLLSNLLSVRYKKMGDGDFSHSNQLTLLNAEGEVIFVHESQTADIAPLVDALKKTLK